MFLESCPLEELFLALKFLLKISQVFDIQPLDSNVKYLVQKKHRKQVLAKKQRSHYE
jgi:hypothetical protein